MRKLELQNQVTARYKTERKKPPLDKLIILARLYDVTVDYILGLTDDLDPKVERKNLNRKTLYPLGWI